MSDRAWHEIWMEQCEAAETIKVRFGVESAFDYVVGEKLLTFTQAATEHPEFARTLPRFVSRVTGMFTAQELESHPARIERIRRENELAAMEVHEPDLEDPTAVAEQARRNLSTTLRHRRFLFTDSFLLLWKWRVG